MTALLEALDTTRVAAAISSERAICHSCGRVTSIPLVISKRAGPISVTTCDECGTGYPEPGSEEAWRRVVNAKAKVAEQLKAARPGATHFTIPPAAEEVEPPRPRFEWKRGKQ